MREPVGGTINVGIHDSVPDRAPFEPKAPPEAASVVCTGSSVERSTKSGSTSAARPIPTSSARRN
jgi:hypothetical protein